MVVSTMGIESILLVKLFGTDGAYERWRFSTFVFDVAGEMPAVFVALVALFAEISLVVRIEKSN